MTARRLCRCRETALAESAVFYARRDDVGADGLPEFRNEAGEVVVGWAHAVGQAGTRGLIFAPVAFCPRCGGSLARRPAPDVAARGARRGS